MPSEFNLGHYIGAGHIAAVLLSKKKKIDDDDDDLGARPVETDSALS